MPVVLSYSGLRAPLFLSRIANGEKRRFAKPLSSETPDFEGMGDPPLGHACLKHQDDRRQAPDNQEAETGKQSCPVAQAGFNFTETPGRDACRVIAK